MSGFTPAPEQVAATEPGTSNWVGANAGAGKTHVLTQRVARLLLAGAAPERILCLTYTKAAAAEMQTRLFQRLGGWAMADEAALARDLAALSGAGGAPDAAGLAEARRLFARALETPGGLKIQTIHAFCERLLRRFPLEAGVSPRFEVADERQSDLMQARIRREMAEAADAGTDDAFDRAAWRLNEGGIDELADAVLARRGALTGGGETALAARYADLAAQTEMDVARAALGALDWPTLAALRAVLLDKGKSSDRPVGEALAAVPALGEHDPTGAVAQLLSKVLTQKGQARSARGFPSADVKKARPSAEDDLGALTAWALETRERLLAVRSVARARDLYGFSGSLIGRLEAAKAGRGLLDFDDLVTRTRSLLTDRDMRAWVLYKLDQGIDHILVDEAQDTSPAQWDVIAAIADEFLAGQGARTEGRSIFVVGDEKQSIYSFQGAEPAAFGAMREHFAARLGALGTPLRRPDLRTSYRSAPAVLSFVDAVFAGEAARALTVEAEPVHHAAHRADDQGRVDLWPLIEPEKTPDPPPWSDPVDAPSPQHPKERLAALVADHIADLVATGRRPARKGQPGAPVRPDDVLVLVATRDRLAKGIIQGLKARGIPVAGADRLKLTAEIAVQDLLALMRVVLMPSDDLSLAALLRSPLCGITEDELFALAHRRPGTLWQAVDAAPAHADAAAFLRDMAAAADFERPYDFLERALIRHDGRCKLLARLGVEVEDPLDELLVQALVYEAAETPSLAGFLAWLEAGEITVKREMDRGTGAVRVMTVHGAKGLEAPVVILPDTISAGNPGGTRPKLYEVEGQGNAPGLVLWMGPKDEDDALARQARETAEARAQAERARLLYVALTRAEDWLILCGANATRARGDSWYPMLAAGMAALAEGGAVAPLPSPTGAGEMLRYETGTPAEGAAAAVVVAPAAPREVPDWLGPAPREVGVERGSPSGLVEKAASGGAGLGRELARRRGSAIHLVLERLGAADPAARADLAPRLLTQSFPDLDPAQRADALAEAERVLTLPAAAALFGPDALHEVSVAIDAPDDGPRMIGRIDILLPGPAETLIVDIKTDAAPPAGPEAVPPAYLAQLGAYAAGTAPAWPDRPVSLAILWTATPGLMRIAHEAADHAFRTLSFARTGRS